MGAISNKTFLACVVLVSVALSACIVEAKLNSKTQALVDRKRNVPRFDFQFKPVPKQFAVKDDAGDKYAQSMAMLTLPGVGMAFITVIATIFFCICRCCVNTCGKRNATRKYELRERSRLRIVYFLLVAIISIGVVVGFLGNFKTTKGIKDGFSVITDTADRVVDDATEAAQALADLPGGSSIAQTEQLVRSAEVVKDDANKIRKDVLNVNSIRELATSIFFGLIFTCVICALVSALGSIAFCSWVMVILGFVAIFFGWLVFGVHLPAGTFIADFCADMENHLTNGAVRTGDGDGVNEVLSCIPEQDQSGPRSNSYNNAVVYRNDAVRKVNAARTRNPSCACPDIPAYTTLELQNTEYDVAGLRNRVTATIAQLRAANLDDAANDLDISNSYLAVLISFNTLANCAGVNKAFDDLEEVFCWTLLTGVDWMLIGGGIAVTFLMFLACCGVRGGKRFRKDNLHTDIEGSELKLVANQPVPAGTYQDQNDSYATYGQQQQQQPVQPYNPDYNNQQAYQHQKNYA